MPSTNTRTSVVIDPVGAVDPLIEEIEALRYRRLAADEARMTELSALEVSPVPAGTMPPAVLATAAAEVVAMRNVWKHFAGVPALRDLTIIVPQGNITVLLGPNGAGKTTAIRMITGAMTADEGSVTVFGADPDRDGEFVRRRCGVV